MLDQKFNVEMRNGTSLTTVLMGYSDLALPTSEYVLMSKDAIAIFLFQLWLLLYIYIYLFVACCKTKNPSKLICDI